MSSPDLAELLAAALMTNVLAMKFAVIMELAKTEDNL